LGSLGGTACLPLLCVVSNTIVSSTNSPASRQITVHATWEYRGQTLEETGVAVIYDRGENVSASIGGQVIAGQVGINPNNSPDNEFTLNLEDGTSVTRDDLTQDYPGCSVAAMFSALGERLFSRNSATSSFRNIPCNRFVSAFTRSVSSRKSIAMPARPIRWVVPSRSRCRA
jgi:hypothetical protein